MNPRLLKYYNEEGGTDYYLFDKPCNIDVDLDPDNIGAFLVTIQPCHSINSADSLVFPIEIYMPINELKQLTNDQNMILLEKVIQEVNECFESLVQKGEFVIKIDRLISDVEGAIYANAFDLISESKALNQD